MKIITIYQDGGKRVVIEDNDNSNLEDYSKSISSLLEFSNISILHTSESSIILRPSKILSIQVEERKDILIKMEDEDEGGNEEETQDTIVEEETKENEEIDIITDGEIQ